MLHTARLSSYRKHCFQDVLPNITSSVTASSYLFYKANPLAHITLYKFFQIHLVEGGKNYINECNAYATK